MTFFSGFRCKTLWTMEDFRPKIDNGAVVIKKDKIIDIGKFSDLIKIYPSSIFQDLGEISLVPGLINIHTHLELSHLHGKTCLGKGFTSWLKSLIPYLILPIRKKRIREIIQHIKSLGIAAVGDITYRAAHKVYSTLKEENMNYCLFIEFFGKKKKLKFPTQINPTLDQFVTVTAHSPYSATKELLIESKKWTKSRNRPLAIHVAESYEEIEFLTSGKGELYNIVRPILPKNFVAPMLHPINYLNLIGLLDNKTLMVHCVWVEREHIEIIKEKGCYVCICPRSNFFIGVGRAPWEDMFKAGIKLCLGTDGLCSNEDLDLWKELEFLINTSKIELSLYEFLKMITINPAQISGLYPFLGTLSIGKKALFSSIPDNIENLFKPKRYV